MPRSKTPLPEEFGSIEEIQDFWDEHSSADYEDEMEDVEIELSPALKSKIELKKLYSLLGFSTPQIAEIEARAKKEEMASRQLMSRWILERI